MGHFSHYKSMETKMPESEFFTNWNKNNNLLNVCIPHTVPERKIFAYLSKMLPQQPGPATKQSDFDKSRMKRRGLLNQRTNGPVNANLISWPSKAHNIQNPENIW